MSISFLGYVLPWGPMSYWGCTVITNLLVSVPYLVPWFIGSFCFPSLSRFFIYHFLLSFLVFYLLFFHIFYLHIISSKNSLGSNINNKISFFPFIFLKDIFGFSIFTFFNLLEIFYGFISLSHPDNALEINVLVTPFHIVPEWYFLNFYSILKAIPNKNAGFMILFSSLFLSFIFGESRYLSLSIILPITGYFSLLLIFLIVFSFLWIGAQLPQEKFISSIHFLLPQLLLPKEFLYKFDKKWNVLLEVSDLL